ncbi:MAG: Fic family protein [Sedimentisphaerales bacterium]|nr:Fic family protein [Sedimentisphaerales bacterium]
MAKTDSNRAGRYISQPGGYKAFIPNPLPPEPPIVMDEEIIRILSLADQNTGRLDGACYAVPDTQLFIKTIAKMYVRREAVDSSKIEGTRASLIDALELEAGLPISSGSTDADEIRNYIEAMNYGLKRLEELPLSLRLLREIHKKLLFGVRGQNRSPGQFRKSQNWIGPPGSMINTATYVPPPVGQMNEALDAFEKFLHRADDIPVLIKIGLLHAQFEIIHPFLDGNGRIGRLLITLFLCQQKILAQPLLYLSKILSQSRQEYYDLLLQVSKNGNWEQWLKFYLRSVIIAASDASEKIREIVSLRSRHRQLIIDSMQGRAKSALIVLENLFSQPLVSIGKVMELLDVSNQTANNLVSDFVEMGILKETTGKKRNRIYMYSDYVQMFMD